MPLKSEHVPGEKSSSFYKKHKQLCEEYEDFIQKLGGSVDGTYNSWGYHVIGSFKGKYKWRFDFRKIVDYSRVHTTTTSDEKYEELIYTSKWQSDHFSMDCPPFIIRKKRILDGFRKILFKSWNDLPYFPNYTIKSGDPKHPIIEAINHILEDLYRENTVYDIRLEDSKLSIDILSQKMYKKEIQALLDLS